MQIEICQAVDFLGRLLQSKVDSNTVFCFKKQLVTVLLERFSNHWDPRQPNRGNGFRAISNFNGADPILVEACNKANCSFNLIHTHLPRDLVLWIDPYSVSYRVGDHGNIMTLYDIKDNNKQHQSSSSPRLQYIQQVQSTPIRVSPPNSPEQQHDFKKLIQKSHLNQPSPLSTNAATITGLATPLSSSTGI
ncbi:hypothetical protein BDF20DRAFT_818469 [Mycotypha africana]|uniref:uncharacterized protein n=1 Tax=Mycotypha africana TaxID=64632 RepID=UPI0022FFDCA6|nr:uncharacterized protein BDF20DRAFT_818469 [Mycotypha africana]KAI8982054.1 hypothetical protein BDF20DRAFT_818469 [Mycotypha africana]